MLDKSAPYVLILFQNINLIARTESRGSLTQSVDYQRGNA